MEATLHDLGRILLNGLPTFFLVILLHFYLKFMFFKPMEKTLAARFDATEGARKAAERSMQNAEARIEEYQRALREARGGIYLEQEKIHRDLEQKNAEELAQVRRGAEARVKLARTDLETESATARQTLAAQSEEMAERIAQSILQGRTA